MTKDKSNLQYGAISTSSYKNRRVHPYMQNDFKGTEEIQEIQRKLLEPPHKVKTVFDGRKSQ